ncbi:hypothetical protein CJF31_00011228 [Rutstroemia sp. NJR-2017a BVV2]|nr:hypothetical protein CJF31_00011228 [Rutstroemia sp. NJR-2017a BVV2]
MPDKDEPRGIAQGRTQAAILGTRLETVQGHHIGRANLSVLCPQRFDYKIEILEEDDLRGDRHHRSVLSVASFRGLLRQQDTRSTDYNDRAALTTFIETVRQTSSRPCKHSAIVVPDSFWLRKVARYILEILGISDDISEEVRSIAEVTEPESDYKKKYRQAILASDSRIFARTRKGYYILGLAVLEIGDIVYVLFGSKVLFCFRPISKFYLFISEYYIYRLIKEEMIDILIQNKLYKKFFDIV